MSLALQVSGLSNPKPQSLNPSLKLIPKRQTLPRRGVGPKAEGGLAYFQIAHTHLVRVA